MRNEVAGAGVLESSPILRERESSENKNQVAGAEVIESYAHLRET